MRIVFAGGGSGGHLLPGAALAGKIVELDPGIECIFLTPGGAIEKTVLKKSGFRQIAIAAPAYPKSLAEKIRWPFTMLAAFCRSLGVLRREGVDFVFGLGGFSSLPPLFAGAALGIRRAAIEQNSIPGMATKILSRGAVREFFTHFDETARRLPPAAIVRRFGCPVRTEVERLAPYTPSTGVRTLLVFGGSAGSVLLNNVVPAAVKILQDRGSESFRVIHIAGEKNVAALRAAVTGLEGYETLGYTDGLPGLLEKADLVISRAGAGTLSELEAGGRPSILIPHATSRDYHQFYNAGHLAARGGAELIEEQDLSPELLAERIRCLLWNDNVLEKMSASCENEAGKLASERIAEYLVTTIRKK